MRIDSSQVRVGMEVLAADAQRVGQVKAVEQFAVAGRQGVRGHKKAFDIIKSFQGGTGAVTRAQTVQARADATDGAVLPAHRPGPEHTESARLAQRARTRADVTLWS